jgi:2-succinyl-5-enolpyruvyl-6-hydroxy-3-cyclohexene-1-carboxylate synthase
MAEGTLAHVLVATFVDELARCGLETVCVTPGSRSTPLAIAFARHPGIRVWPHIDERSAAFFALGMARRSRRPVGLLCTSGTAAVEFHPAVVEAYHAGVPLLVLTADRPPELREVGANQAIDQTRLYGTAVRWFFDPGPPDDLPEAPRRWRQLAARALAEAAGPPAGPVHLNLPFREPLTPPAGTTVAPVPADREPVRLERGRALPSEEVVERVARALARARRPLIVAGELEADQRLSEVVARLLARIDAPFLAEPTSHLRRRGMPGLIETYDALLRVEGWATAHRPDVVLRLGAVPTSKALGQFLGAGGTPTIVVDPGGAWRDPDRLACEVIRSDPEALLAGLAERLEGTPGRWRHEWEEAGERASSALDRCLRRLPLFEAHVVRALAELLPEEATVMAGSSLAVRELETFWPATGPGQRFVANRGASGIDGLVSTGLGAAAVSPGSITTLLLGDLSLYHDMNGLWAIRRHGLRAALVVLDNDGGGIFHHLPQVDHPDVFEDLFATPLGLQMENVARLYGLGFVEVRSPDDLVPALTVALTAPETTLVAVRFDRRASAIAHRACWSAVAAELEGSMIRSPR